VAAEQVLEQRLIWSHRTLRDTLRRAPRTNEKITRLAHEHLAVLVQDVELEGK
jgi:hypothetical protein